MDPLDALRNAISSKPPYCTGTIPITDDNGVVYYRKQEQAGWLDLSRATEGDLEALVQACEPATFGLEQRDVLDESYRKAWKMDRTNFAPRFDIGESHLVERIRAQLLDARDNTKGIKAELYKLNVYGKDSFFKSHKDTPRSDTMFGSLVVVFPTPHEGGALVLRHAGQEWTFDSAAVLREKEQRSMAYIAFFSDVDHEVTVVTSGYRVTLTYNLFFESGESDHPASDVVPVAFKDTVFQTALTSALEDPNFLPKGGCLGFGLSFKYPIKRGQSLTSLRKISKMLKGNDSMIKHVCEQMKLPTTLNAIYQDKYRETKILVDEIMNMGDGEIEGLLDLLAEYPHNGRLIYDYGEEPPRTWHGPIEERSIGILWVTPLTTYSHFNSPYVHYGNEASLGCAYGDLCLTVKVGPYENRRGSIESL
ncbi:hypothetical protein Hypma_004839 [Hypsizygus marmoreus]|uniref:Fe2OG dioxygenase domain-containing protein n=1 Tax=Hypsizygus marmoreus TaxID=39966 RepID=A0A369IZK8_HYPMA|nr:hypothetical protein Hypma_004839 [Hypsizygus marmoreus]